MNLIKQEDANNEKVSFRTALHQQLSSYINWIYVLKISSSDETLISDDSFIFPIEIKLKIEWIP